MINSSADIHTLLPVAIQAADAANKEILKVYNSADFQTELKDDRSPVTLADRSAHEVIAKSLTKTGIPILSEEGKTIPYSERKSWECFWLVDPLDGTKEFLKRNDEFTVNIALIMNEEPVLGVVTIPVTGDVYYATKGEGAFHRLNDVVTPLEKRKPADLNKTGLRVVASRSHMNEETTTFIQQLKEPKLISAGSSLKFIAVAKGEADLYPRYIPCMEWDTAAADVIVREVGLSVVDIINKQPLSYNKENLLNPFFICS
jgi:3'(2'), 5'-bisphosphate nucleotidase